MSNPPFGLPQDFMDSKERNNLPNLAEGLGDYESFSSTAYVKDLVLKTYKYHSFMIAEALQPSDDDQDGHYVIEYVDLMDYDEACVWYPQLKCFGTMDRDHGYLFACKGKGWDEISNNTGIYLVGKWEWEEGWDYILDPRKEEGTFPFVPKSED